jgi:predicted Zn-dependent peptidase
MESRLIEREGYTLQLIRTGKFKTFSLALRFSGAFSATDLNARALLPDVLLGGTKKNPSKESLQTRMDGLYGLSVNCGTDKIGRQSVIYFEMKSVNGAYLPGEKDTLPDALDLLHEIIYEPKLVKGSFRKKTVYEEVRLLKEDFEAEYIDKTEYAYNRFMEEMFKEELHKYRAKGIYEELGFLTPEKLTEAYRKMLLEDHVTILAVGDFDFAAIERQIAARFAFRSPKKTETWLDTETKTIEKSEILHEYSDMNQARINIGYRIDVRFGDPDYYGTALMNGILGEFEHSKLFQIVREKHTLCYYVNSMYDANKGHISIMAGVDPDKEAPALALIAEVIRSLQNGDVTDEELMLAKESLSKRIRQNVDSPERLSNLAFLYQTTLHREYDPEASLTTIQNVRREDVVRLGQKMILDTTYVLTKKAE